MENLIPILANYLWDFTARLLCHLIINRILNEFSYSNINKKKGKIATSLKINLTFFQPITTFASFHLVLTRFKSFDVTVIVVAVKENTQLVQNHINI